MNKHMKKVFPLLLTFVMIAGMVSSMPLAVYAGDVSEAGEEAAENQAYSETSQEGGPAGGIGIYSESESTVETEIPLGEEDGVGIETAPAFESYGIDEEPEPPLLEEQEEADEEEGSVEEESQLSAFGEGDVCSIGDKFYQDFDTALLEVTSGQSIRLLQNIEYLGQLVVDGVSVESFILDLNGFNLDVRYTGDGAAVLVKDGASLRTNDANGGEFSAYGSARGVQVETGGIVTLTNAVGSSMVTGGFGAYIGSNGGIGQITVFKSVKGYQSGAVIGGPGLILIGSELEPGSAMGETHSGVYASNGGEIIIYGEAKGENFGAWGDGAGTKVTVHGTAETFTADHTDSYGFGVYSSSSAEVTINGDATGSNIGAVADTGGRIIAAGSVIGKNLHGAYAKSGGKISITGVASGAIYGALAKGTGSEVYSIGSMNGSTDDNSYGAYALDGGYVGTAEDAIGLRYGAVASGAGSRVVVGGVAAAIGTGTGNHVGAWANNSGYVKVSGEIRGEEVGVLATQDTDASFGETARVEALGNVTATGVGVANRLGVVIVGGAIQAQTYIRILAHPTGVPSYSLDLIREDTSTRPSDIGPEYQGYSWYFFEEDLVRHSYTVVAGDTSEAVCSINERKYSNLSDALTAVKDGETIKLLKDINHNEAFQVSTKSFSFDLNGFTLAVETGQSGIGAVMVTDGKTVGYTGEGEFNVKGVDFGAAVLRGGNLTVTNATATGAGGTGAAITDGNGGYLTVTKNAKGVENGVSVIGDGLIRIGSVEAPGSAYGENGAGATAKDGGSVIVYGDSIGRDFGAFASGEDSSVHVEKMAMADNSLTNIGIGAHAGDGGKVTVLGNAVGLYFGAEAVGNDSKVSVLGNAVATSLSISAEKGFGAYADDGGLVDVGGDAICEKNVAAFAEGGGKISIGREAVGWVHGSWAKGKGSEVSVARNSIGNSDIPGIGFGAFAEDGGKVTIGGDSVGSSVGVAVSETLTAANMVRPIADYTTAVVKGRAVATNSDGKGVGNAGGVIFIEGGISAPVYISVAAQSDLGVPLAPVHLTAGDSKNDRPAHINFTGIDEYAWYYFQNDEDTIWHSYTFVKEGEYVASIAEKKYERITDAFSEVKTGETVKLLRDVSYSGRMELTSGKSFTLDLNGHDLSIQSTDTGYPAFLVANKSELKLKGSGEFNVTGTLAGIEVQTGGRVTVTSATATGGHGAYIGAIGGDGAINVLRDARGSKTGAYAGSSGFITVGTSDWPGNSTGDSEAGAYARNGGKVDVKGSAIGSLYGAYAEGLGSNVSIGKSATADGPGSAGAYAKDGGGITVSYDAVGAGYGVKVEEILPYDGSVRPLDEFTRVSVGGYARATDAGGIGVFNGTGIVYIETEIEADRYIVVGAQPLFIYPETDESIGKPETKDWPTDWIVNEYAGQLDNYRWYYYEHFKHDSEGNPILDGSGKKILEAIHSYTLVNGNPDDAVAQIEAKKYDDLEKALADIAKREPDNTGKPPKDKDYAEITLILLKDIEYPGGIVLKDTKLTIDARGHNLSFGRMTSTGIGLLMDGSTLAVKGPGEVSAFGIQTGIHLQNASKASLTSAEALAGTGAEVMGGSSLTLSGDVKGVSGGLHAQDAGTTVIILNAVASAQDGIGVTALDKANVTIKGSASGGGTGVEATNSVVTITGNSTGGELGIAAFGKDTKITVQGSVYGTDTIGIGVYAEDGAKVEIAGDAQGDGYGAVAKTKGSIEIRTSAIGGSGGAYAEERGSIIVNVALGTAAGSFGAGADTGGKVSVETGAQGQLYGAFSSGILPADVDNPKGVASSVTVKGDAEATAAGSAGAYAINGGRITVSGNAIASGWGAIATGQGSKVTISKDAIATNGVGVDAKSGGSIDTMGSASGVSGGAYAEGSGSKIKVAQNIVVTDSVGGYGVQSVDGADISVSGKITSAYIGVTASRGGKATVGNVPDAPIYIALDGWVVFNNDYTLPTTKAGYLTYTNDISAIWIRGSASDLPEPRAKITGFSFDRTALPVGGGVVTATLTGINLNSPGTNVEIFYDCSVAKLIKMVFLSDTTILASFMIEPNISIDNYVHSFMPVVDGILQSEFYTQVIQSGRPAPLNKLTFNLPDATQGSYYCVYLNIDGANDRNFTWRVSGLPNGLSVDPSTGHMTGVTFSAGDYKFSGTVTDQYGNITEVDYSITIHPSRSPVRILSAAISNERVGANFEVNFVVEGGLAPYTWNMSGLPGGVTYDSQTGRIAGIPESAATYAIVVSLTDANGDSAAGTLVIVIGTSTMTDEEKALADAASLTWDAIKGANASADGITSNLNLTTTGANGSNVVWSSLNPSIEDDGTVIRPEFDEENTEGELYAFVVNGSSVEVVEFSTTVVKLTAPTYACQIGSTSYGTLIEALAAVQSGETIKLLKSISHGVPIVIDGKNITIDLDRYNLVVDAPGARGLEVINGGKIITTGIGRFILKGGNDAIFVSGAGSEAVVGSVSASGNSFAVSVLDGGKATINGSITAQNGSGARVNGTGSSVIINGNIMAAIQGVNAGAGSNVTINGSIIINGENNTENGIGVISSGDTKVTGNVRVSGKSTVIGAKALDGGIATIDGEIVSTGTYLMVQDTAKTKQQNTTPTTKPGYSTYTDDISTIWVKGETSGFIPVTDITGVPSSAMPGTITLSAGVVPSDATNKAIIWSIKDAGTSGATISGNKLSAPKEGRVTITATIENGLAVGMAYTQDFTIIIVDGYICQIVGLKEFTSLEEALGWTGIAPRPIEIRLLRSIDYTGTLNINDKNVIFNLNGYNLNVGNGLIAIGSYVGLTGSGEFNINGRTTGVVCRASDIEVTSINVDSAYVIPAIQCSGGLFPNGQPAHSKINVRGDVTSTYPSGATGNAIAIGGPDGDSTIIINGSLATNAGVVEMRNSTSSIHIKGDVYAGYGDSGKYAITALAGKITIGGSLYSTDNLVNLGNSAVAVGGSMHSSLYSAEPVGVNIAQPSYSGSCTVDGDIRCVIRFGSNSIDTANGVYNGDTSMPGYYYYGYAGYAGKVYAGSLPGAFVTVTDITGIPVLATTGTPLRLGGSVLPADATFKSIIWSVKDAGTTGATVGIGQLHTTSPGTVIITATVLGGLGSSADFTKDFTIDAYDPVVPVTGIMGLPSSVVIGMPLTLKGTVLPANATNYSIQWSVKDAGPTGAVISGDQLTATAAGTMILTATILDGKPFGEPFVYDFSIKAVTSEYICEIGSTQYTNLAAALAAVGTGGAATIKLLQPIKHTNPVVIDNKRITFNLNGFDLEIDVGNILGSIALEVRNNGYVYLEGAGEFNVIGGEYGVYVHGICDVTVSNATSTGYINVMYYQFAAYAGGGAHLTITGNAIGKNGIMTYGLYNEAQLFASANTSVFVGGDVIAGDGIALYNYGSVIHVLGKVTAHNGHAVIDSSRHGSITVGSVETSGSGDIGIRVSGKLKILGDCSLNGRTRGIHFHADPFSFGDITIDGSLTYDGENVAYYGYSLYLGSDEYLIPSTKLGYVTYSFHNSNIWIKDLSAEFIPVADIKTSLSMTLVGFVDQPHLLSATVMPETATNKYIAWSVKDAGTTGASISGSILTAASAGTVIVTATITDGAAVGIDFIKDFTIRFDSKPGEYVCEIVGGDKYGSLEEAIGEIGKGEEKTIRILRSIYTDRYIEIEDKSITIDLNGFDVLVNTGRNYDPGSRPSLSVNRGNFYITGTGEFNIFSSKSGIVVTGNSNVMVSNVTSWWTVYGGTGSNAVIVKDGGRVSVTGDIKSYVIGVWAEGRNTRVFVGGDVRTEYHDSGYLFYGGIYAVNSAAVEVAGNVTSYAPRAILAYENAVVTVGSVNYIHWVPSGTTWPYFNNGSIVLGISSKVFVLGDYSVTGSTTVIDGIEGVRFTSWNSEVTIDGIFTSEHGPLIKNYRGELTQISDFVTPTTKPGYKTYTTYNNNTVWLKEPGAPSFISVAAITGIPDTIAADTIVSLDGEVVPSAANNNNTITWSVKNAGSTGAVISGDLLYTSAVGTLILTATVEDGIDIGVPYTQDFTINVLGYLCEIVETGAKYFTLDEALSDVLDGESKTIRLLASIEHGSGIVVENKSITFDLNGFDLNVNVGTVNNSVGLDVKNGGNVYLAGAGELNITGKLFGVRLFGPGEVTVSNATATGQGTSYDSGVYVDGGGKLTVKGDVRGGGAYASYASGSNSKIHIMGDSIYNRIANYYYLGYNVKAVDYASIEVSGQVRAINGSGIYADYYSTISSGSVYVENGPGNWTMGVGAQDTSVVNVYGDCVVKGADIGIISAMGGNVTIDGIYSTDAADYILIEYFIPPGSYDSEVFGPSDFKEPTTKPGYLTYTINNDGNVWIKDGAVSYVPVTNISGVPGSVMEKTPLSLAGTVSPDNATNKDIVWSIKDAGTTGSTISGGNILNTTAAGTVVVTATIANGQTMSTDYAKDFSITVNPISLEGISVTTLPGKTVYTVGETLDLTGMVVKATYSDGSISEVTNHVTTTPAGGSILSATGTQGVTVSYTEGGVTKSTGFTVAVNAVPVVLDSIAVTTVPAVTTYTVGDALNLTGMVVTATYSDGSTADVSLSATTTPADGAALNTAGSQTVDVSYTEGGITKNTSFSVTVSAAPVILDSISVSTPPDKTAYTAGDSLDLTGMVVTATYSDGSTNTVVGFTTNPASGATLSALGTQTVMVSYAEGGVTKTTTFSVIVSAVPVVLDSISVTALPAKTTYIVGETLDLTGMVVKATYSDGGISEVTTLATSIPAGGSILGTIGTQSVAVSYTEGGITKTSSFTVAVNDIVVIPVLDSISVTTNPAKTTYIAGDALDLTGMVVTASYSDGSTADVTASIATSPADGSSLGTVGTQPISVSYTEGSITKSASFSVAVNAVAVVLDSITVTTPPTTTSYTVGDTLDLSGMVVTATYSDGSYSAVSGYATDPLDGAALTVVGAQGVTVSYTDGGVTKTAYFTVQVNAAPVLLDSIAVTTSPVKTAYTEGESLDLTGMVVTAAYSDGSTADVTASVTTDPVNGTALTGPGSKTITVSYADGSITKTTSLTVSIIAVPVTLDSIAVTTAPIKSAYTVGDSLDLTGMVVTATYSDGSSNAVTGYTTSPLDGSVLNTAGSQTVGISYTEGGITKTTSIIVTVHSVSTVLTGIAVTTQPVIAVYTAGDTLDLTGMVVTASYSDGSSGAVTSYITNPLNGAVLNTAGSQTVDISYTEGSITKTTSIVVTVNSAPVVLASISISTQPVKTVYVLGDTLDLTGMAVTAAYSDGSTGAVTGYVTDPVDGAALNTTGLKSVFVSYTENGVTKGATLTVTVSPLAPVLDSIKITSMPGKLTYTAGEILNLNGLVITAYYSDGSSMIVTGYVTNPANNTVLSAAGGQTVVITYTEGAHSVTVSFTVSVNPKPVGGGGSGGGSGGGGNTGGGGTGTGGGAAQGYVIDEGTETPLGPGPGPTTGPETEPGSSTGGVESPGSGISDPIDNPGQIGDPDVPLTDFKAAGWSISNMILCLIGILLAVMIPVLMRRRSGEWQGGPLLPALTVLLGAAGIAVFFLTQDVRQGMAPADSFTFVFAAILAAEIICARLLLRKTRNV